MPSDDRPQIGETSKPTRRHAGWAVLVGTLGVACLIIGLVLVGMIRAPAVRHPVVTTAYAFIAAGLLLVPLAWLGRRPRDPEVTGGAADAIRPDLLHEMAQQGGTNRRTPPAAFVHLTPANAQKLERIARRDNRTVNEVANELFDRLADPDDGTHASNMASLAQQTRLDSTT